MKHLHIAALLITGAVALQSCTGGRQVASSYPQDDLYYHPKDEKYLAAERARQAEQAAALQNDTRDNANYGTVDNPNSAAAYENDRRQNVFGNSNGSNNYSSGGNANYGSTNNYYYYNNYYDNDLYPYSNRINRFYHPYHSFGYWDPFYTPGWHVSIGYGSYYGYSPYGYNPYAYNPYGYGYGYNYGYPGGFGYNPYGYYDPFGYGYYNSGSYWMGYNNGFNSGFYNGYYAGNYKSGNSGGSGSGNGGGMSSYNRYYGPRTTAGAHSIQNSGTERLPSRWLRENPAPGNAGNNAGNINQVPQNPRNSQVIDNPAALDNPYNTPRQQNQPVVNPASSNTRIENLAPANSQSGAQAADPAKVVTPPTKVDIFQDENRKVNLPAKIEINPSSESRQNQEIRPAQQNTNWGNPNSGSNNGSTPRWSQPSNSGGSVTPRWEGGGSSNGNSNGGSGRAPSNNGGSAPRGRAR